MAIVNRIKYDGPGVDSEGNKIPWLIYKFPNEDLVVGSQLIVFESQEAVFHYTGKVFDIFGPGRHTLTKANLPLIQSVVNIPFGGNTPFTSEVYFINKVSKLDLKWGTDTPIQIQEPKFGILIGVRSFGQFGIRIKDPKKFIKNITGSFQKNEISNYRDTIEYFKGLLLSEIKSYITDTIINKKVSIFEIQAQLDEISTKCKERIEKEYDRFGIEIVNFFVQSINTPQKDLVKLKDMLDNKAIFDNLGDDKYKIMRGFDALEKMASNEGAAGQGVGMGTSLFYGLTFSKIFGEAFTDSSKSGKGNNTVNGDSLSVNDLEKLHKLMDKGIITKEEYNKTKKKILGI